MHGFRANSQSWALRPESCCGGSRKYATNTFSHTRVELIWNVFPIHGFVVRSADLAVRSLRSVADIRHEIAKWSGTTCGEMAASERLGPCETQWMGLSQSQTKSGQTAEWSSPAMIGISEPFDMVAHSVSERHEEPVMRDSAVLQGPPAAVIETATDQHKGNIVQRV